MVGVAVAALVPVGVTDTRLGDAAADHVADGQDRDVEPHLVGGEDVGAALFTLDRVAGDQDRDHHQHEGEELARLEELLGLGRQPPGGLTDTATAAAIYTGRAGRHVDRVTIRDYRGVIDGYLLAEFGDQPIDAITPDMIDAYKEKLITERRLSNRVIVRHLTVLHGIFKRAARVWGLEEPGLGRPGGAAEGRLHRRVRHLDRRRGRALARAAPTSRTRRSTVTAAYTGLRQGELLALRWRDVDLVGGLLHVRRNYTDGGRRCRRASGCASVPMMPRGGRRARPAQGPRALHRRRATSCSATRSADHLDSWALRRRYYAAFEQAGLRRIRFHDLRHRFGSLAITVLDPYAVQSYMGHQHYSTTQRTCTTSRGREDALRLQAAADAQDMSPNRVPNWRRSERTESN